MGYSPCKKVSLGQNLKIRKRCEKRRFYDHIRVDVCKKPRQKTPNSKKKGENLILKMARIRQKDGL